MLAEDAPKWGNDDPDVDAVVMELCDFIIKIHAELKGILGNPKMPALYPVSSNVPQGLSIGALPSGRRAGKPLADGCSPSQGCDRFGPTAILRSLDKMPHACLDGGTLLNLWLTPAVVQGEEGGHRLSAFLKAFLDMDIFHIQFNVVGRTSSAAPRNGPRNTARSSCAWPGTAPISSSSAARCRTTSSAARSTPCNARDGPP